MVNNLDFKKQDEFKSLRRKSRVSKCLFSHFGMCSSGVIKAHSIQNNRILRNISRNGKIIAFGSEGEFEEIGRKVATIFTGFCSKHDTEIFNPIENKDYVLGNREQEFLFAYRALCRELIAKEEARNIFRHLYEEKKISVQDMHGNTWVDAEEIGLLDMNSIKKILDEKLMDKEFDSIETFSIAFDQDYKFAVSSIFNLEYDFNNQIVNNLANIKDEMKPLFLTIFPQNNKTYVLFSYLKKHMEAYRFLKEQLLNSSFEDKTKKISLLITLYCENFVYSPEKWDELTLKDKEKFKFLFHTTIYQEKLNFMNLSPPINFFLLD